MTNGTAVGIRTASAPKVNATGTGRRIARKRSKRLMAFGWYGGKFSHLDFLLPLIPQDAMHFCDVFASRRKD